MPQGVLEKINLQRLLSDLLLQQRYPTLRRHISRLDLAAHKLSSNRFLARTTGAAQAYYPSAPVKHNPLMHQRRSDPIDLAKGSQTLSRLIAPDRLKFYLRWKISLTHRTALSRTVRNLLSHFWGALHWPSQIRLWLSSDGRRSRGEAPQAILKRPRRPDMLGILPAAPELLHLRPSVERRSRICEAAPPRICVTLPEQLSQWLI